MGLQVWYPCGSFKGDDRSAALAKSYADGGMLSGISKKQLDGGIAGSLYQDLAKLKETSGLPPRYASHPSTWVLWFSRGNSQRLFFSSLAF